MNILIVDDNFASRRLLRAYLKGYGECHLATNGQEAIDSFKENTADSAFYDLICLDIMMPAVDGHEVLKTIRQIEQTLNITEENQVKIIICSALDDRNDVVKSFDYGASAYLVKPIEVGHLKNALLELGIT
jgi:two-component system chemotaxis response regulator CheY